jgi:hypothetical protein
LRGGAGGPSLPAAIDREVRERFSPWRSGRALRHRLKVSLFGNFMSSPVSYYLRGRR